MSEKMRNFAPAKGRKGQRRHLLSSRNSYMSTSNYPLEVRIGLDTEAQAKLALDVLDRLGVKYEFVKVDDLKVMKVLVVHVYSFSWTMWNEINVALGNDIATFTIYPNL